MFEKTARFYDAIYAWKDYDAEVQRLHELIQLHKRTPDVNLLDVACGTGKHLCLLEKHYVVEGLDADAKMLEIARERCPGAIVHQGDMVDFKLDTVFDVVVCLFSSIGYAKTLERMRQAVATMAAHLKPGGVLMVEPWFSAEQFRPAGIFARFVDEPDLKIARMHAARVEDGVSILDFHYLIGTPDGVEHVTELHELGMFTPEQYRAAFEDAGLAVTFDEQGLDGRGLYVGAKPVKA